MKKLGLFIFLVALLVLGLDKNTRAFFETPSDAARNYLLAFQAGNFDQMWEYCFACQEEQRKMGGDSAYKEWERETNRNSGNTDAMKQEFAFAKISVLGERKNKNLEKINENIKIATEKGEIAIKMQLEDYLERAKHGLWSEQLEVADSIVTVKVEYPSPEKGRIDINNDYKRMQVSYYEIPVFDTEDGYEVGHLGISKVIHF